MKNNIFYGFTLLTCLLHTPVFAVPGNTIVDSQTIALWHFDDYLSATDRTSQQFLDVGGTHPFAVSNTTTATVISSAGYNQLGKAVSGFNGNANLECKTVCGDYPNQTFEAWISWQSAADLPQNADGATSTSSQIVSANLVSTTFSTRFGFEAGNLILQLRQGDAASDMQTVSIPISNLSSVPKEHVWYHLAYTIQQNASDNYTVSLYWNDEDYSDNAPAPAITTTLTNFTYRQNGWRLMLGKRFGSSNDLFLGQIDEVRFSNAVRTTFDTFLNGDLNYYHPSKTFVVASAISASGLPSLSSYGIQKINGIHDNTFWPGTSASNP